MNLNEFKDSLFEILNETDKLPVMDLELDDPADTLKVFLPDGSLFKIQCEKVQWIERTKEWKIKRSF